MINNIIETIQTAETEAEQILRDAAARVQQIDKQNQMDTESIKTASAEETAAKLRDQENKFNTAKKEQTKSGGLVVSKAAKDAAKKFILSEFNKRYMR